MQQVLMLTENYGIERVKILTAGGESGLAHSMHTHHVIAILSAELYGFVCVVRSVDWAFVRKCACIDSD